MRVEGTRTSGRMILVECSTADMFPNDSPILTASLNASPDPEVTADSKGRAYPTVKLVLHPPKRGYRGLTVSTVPRTLRATCDVEMLPISSNKVIDLRGNGVRGEDGRRAVLCKSVAGGRHSTAQASLPARGGTQQALGSQNALHCDAVKGYGRGALLGILGQNRCEDCRGSDAAHFGVLDHLLAREGPLERCPGVNNLRRGARA